MKKLIVTFVLMGAYTGAFAQGVPNTNQGRPPHERNPAMEAAIRECRGSVAKDGNGHPNHESMHACMRAKGFNPPEHHGHPGEGQGNNNGSGTPQLR